MRHVLSGRRGGKTYVTRQGKDGRVRLGPGQVSTRANDDDGQRLVFQRRKALGKLLQPGQKGCGCGRVSSARREEGQ